MRQIAENRQYQFRIAPIWRGIVPQPPSATRAIENPRDARRNDRAYAWQLKLPGRIAMPAARAFEKMLLNRSVFADEKFGQAANV
jgi:hypothetical protein